MQDPKLIKAYENMGVVIDFCHGEDWIKDMKETYGINSLVKYVGCSVDRKV